MKQEGAYIRAERAQCRLEDCICYSLKTFYPLPALMAIQFFQVIEIVLNAYGVLVASTTIDDHTALLRNTVQELRQIRQIGEVGGLVDHKNDEIEAFEVQ